MLGRNRVPREKARRRRENYEESERPKIDREFGLITLLKKKTQL